ncbi:MAG: hypothetical protein BGO49_11700 [Planctomycetales bacterium 71-10]|nr:MAG: hypothetical protein BGO49_11700 [Planctomycetales bacterium 71-10]
MDDMNPEQAELVIEGAETVDHTVPADVLLRTLEHLQRLVHLLAAAGEGRTIRERFSPPEDFRKRYQLRCGVSRASSYAVPLSLASTEPLFESTEDQGPSALVRTMDVMEAAARGDWSKLVTAARDPRILSRVLAELRGMLPRPGDRWGISFRIGARRVALGPKEYRAIRDYASPDMVEDTMMTVTGDLVRVDIEARRIVIRHRPTGREIRCDCEESVLGSILEHWSEPIQVTGRFSLDRKGHPTRLTNVTRVEPVDLSPLTFDRIEWSGKRLRIAPPLTLTPSLDEDSGQYYTLTDAELGLDVFATTREEVADELAEQVMFQWDAYAREKPERLTVGAQRLREALLARMREDELASQTEGR